VGDIDDHVTVDWSRGLHVVGRLLEKDQEIMSRYKVAIAHACGRAIGSLYIAYSSARLEPPDMLTLEGHWFGRIAIQSPSTDEGRATR